MPYKDLVKRTAYSKKYREANRERKLFYSQAARIRILTHYGNGKCACVKCGFNDVRALSVDHIDGYGRRLPKAHSNRSGTGLYYWLIRSGYPEGFQTLCMNCQFIKRTVNKERAGIDCKYNHDKTPKDDITRLL